MTGFWPVLSLEKYHDPHGGLAGEFVSPSANRQGRAAHRATQGKLR